MVDPAHDPTASDDAVALDDEPIFTTPNRHLIERAGKLARAEQTRLEQLYQLQGGRTPGLD